MLLTDLTGYLISKSAFPERRVEEITDYISDVPGGMMPMGVCKA